MDPADAPAAQVLKIAADDGIPASVALSASDLTAVESQSVWNFALAREEGWVADHQATWASVADAAGPLSAEIARAEPRWRMDRGPVLELAAPQWAADAVVMRLVSGGMLLVGESHGEGPLGCLRLVSAGTTLDSITLRALPGSLLDRGNGRALMTAKAARHITLARIGSEGGPRLADIVDLAESGWFEVDDRSPFDPAADLDSTMRRVALAAGARGDRARSLRRVLVVTGGDRVRRAALVRRTTADIERVQLAEEVAVMDAGAAAHRPSATTRLYQRAKLPTRRRVDTVEVRLLSEPGAGAKDPVNDAKRAVHVVVAGEHLLDRAPLLRAATGNRKSRSAGATTPGTGWQMLLPVDPRGPVVGIDLATPIGEALRFRYPDLVSIARSMGPLRATNQADTAGGRPAGLVWDGRNLPLRHATSGLVIIDERRGGGPSARSSMGPGAALASIGPSRVNHDYALYPHPEDLLWVTRRGWPLIGGNTGLSRVRRWRARTLLWSFMDRAGLTVNTPGPTTIDLVLDDLERATGRRYELRGIITRNFDQATLCVDAGSRLSVRVGLTPRGRSRISRLEEAQQRVLSMPGPLPFEVPKIVAKGEAAGVVWLAEEWIEGRPGPGGRRWWTRSGEGWAVGRSVATALSEGAATGTTEPGWASNWGALAAGQGTSEKVMSSALCAVEDAHVATAWCHGDLWPGNVLFLRRNADPVVIDWDSARPDAPAGIDAIHMEIDRVAWRLRCSVGVAAALLVATGAPGLRGVGVGGRNWADWDTAVRGGLVAAAVALRASRASEGPGGYNEPWTDEMLPPLVAALRSLR